MTSPEFELAMVHTEYDAAIKSLVVASKLAARYQGRAEKAEAALARIEAVCVTGVRVANERMVSGSVVHVAAKDAIDTFAKAIRDVNESKP